MALLFSNSKLAGVTGDVRIWNKKESFLARMSALRYWFAFKYVTSSRVVVPGGIVLVSDHLLPALSVPASPDLAAWVACPARLVSTRSAT